MVTVQKVAAALRASGYTAARGNGTLSGMQPGFSCSQERRKIEPQFRFSKLRPEGPVMVHYFKSWNAAPDLSENEAMITAYQEALTKRGFTVKRDGNYGSYFLEVS